MTMNKDDLTTVTNNEQVNQEEAFDNLTEFYKDNEHLVEILGGLDIFNTLFEMDDEQFKLIAPYAHEVFENTLSDRKTQSEISTLLASEEWEISELEKELEVAYFAIDEMEELSSVKKDFIKKAIASLGNAIRKIQRLQAVDIPCELIGEVQLPTYAHETDAGLDIYAKEEITITPGETKIIGTGIKTAIPKGYAILIQPRSGQSVKTKLRIANTPGLIDSGYRDEIGVIIENIEPPFKDIDYEFDDNGEIHIKSILHGQPYTIAKGQKFAQMRLVKVPTINFVKVDSVQNIGENRGGGFGHTG